MLCGKFANWLAVGTTSRPTTGSAGARSRTGRRANTCRARSAATA